MAIAPYTPQRKQIRMASIDEAKRYLDTVWRSKDRRDWSKSYDGGKMVIKVRDVRVVGVNFHYAYVRNTETGRRGQISWTTLFEKFEKVEF